jgi:uncharacterized protein (PEP-CTERM system associated)
VQGQRALLDRGVRITSRRHCLPWLAGLLASTCWAVAGACLADPADQPPGAEAVPGNVIVQSAPPTPAAGAPPIFLTPILGVQESYTDNVLLVPSDQKPDFVTRFMAGLNLNVDDGPTVGMLTSQLAYDQYAHDTRLSGWSVRAYANGSFFLVKDVLSIDALGSTTNGNVSQFGTPAIDRSGVLNRTQFTTYAIGPHLKTTLGDVADVEAVARWDQVFYAAANGSTVNHLPSDSNITQVAGLADTGKRLGGLELITSAQYESDDHGFSTADGVESGYFRVLQGVRLIGRAGYEYVHIPFITTITAPVLTAGLEFTPNDKSRISIEGGERYNRETWAANAYVQLSGHLYLSADYYEVLEPDQVYIANSFLSFSQLMAQPATPLIPTNPSFVINGNLYNQPSLNKTADGHLVYEWPRETLDVSATWVDQDFLKLARHDRTLLGQAIFTSQLRPDLAATARVSYARVYSSPVFGPSEIYTAEGTILYNVNSTVDLNAGYAFNHQQESAVLRQTIYENVVFVSLQKRF